MTIQRWKLTIEYDGTDYAGWQRQQSGVPSVQESIEIAIHKFCQQNIRLHVAGRTDAGVHAAGQVAHLDLDYGDRELTPFQLAKAINAHLQPQKIAILKAEMVHNTFHARFDAVSKLYHYRVLTRTAPPTYDRDRVWHVFGSVNADAMAIAAKDLLGYQDFTSFRAKECQAKSPMRSIERADVVRNGDYIDFYFEGRSFLHHQVRNMVGSLMMVGKEKWEIFKIKEVLMAKERAIAGMTAPPQGLSLVQILYPNQ